MNGFAEALTKKDVKVWMDDWVLLPGDSIVEKIYDEGISKSDIMIVVLSQNSVESKWVKDEINTGKIISIEQGMKIIPIIIDDCKVPECLKSTLFEKISDVGNYSKSLDRIIAAIFDIGDRKSPGCSPKYVDTHIVKLGTLNRIDNIVFRLSCEKAIGEGHPFLNIEDLEQEFIDLEISRDQYNESLEILDGRFYIKAIRVNSPYIPSFNVTSYGFQEYLLNYIENYEDILKNVIFEIANKNWHSEEVAEKQNIPVMITNHIFNWLADQNLVRLSKVISPYEDIYHMSPELKRLLEQIN